MGAVASFTLEGLGYEHRPDSATVINHTEGAAETAAYKAMFESIWDNPATVEDVTERVAEQVETLYRENAPEFVYFLTLYHLFREYMDDEEDNGIRSGLNFEDSAIWGKLYDFQKDAVVGAIHKLEKYKGAIMADHDLLWEFFALILPHGLLELTCIFVAGGAGLRLFWTLLVPGPRSRGVALATEGRALMTVAVGLTGALAVAGVIEAFVTPAPMPWAVKITIGALALAALWVYTLVLGRRARR